ncbi:hypothetical protein [Sulfurimonas sp. CS5]|uniref:hypothetical protein n=1 Tax=Sulfurimonas sp. CS5 TaxID=3391145 RepID=UPI0039E74BA1
MENDDSSMGLVAHVHDDIHTILVFNKEEEFSITIRLSDTKPLVSIENLTSCISSVPQRQPLS